MSGENERAIIDESIGATLTYLQQEGQKVYDLFHGNPTGLQLFIDQTIQSISQATVINDRRKPREDFDVQGHCSLNIHNGQLNLFSREHNNCAVLSFQARKVSKEVPTTFFATTYWRHHGTILSPVSEVMFTSELLDQSKQLEELGTINIVNSFLQGIREKIV